MFSCLIVDDEAMAHNILNGYLADLDDFKVSGNCLNALQALTFLDRNNIDLMFLDIEMPKLKGLDFLKMLDHPPQVIITTAHRNYALEGYDLDVVDYLLKPISFDRFLKALNRFKKNIIAAPGNLELPKYLYVKSERKTLKLLMSEISHIEGMNNYIKIHIGGKTHVVYSSLTKISDDLTSHFCRIHKSYIINKTLLTSFNSEWVEVESKKIPVGKTYVGVLGEL